MTVYTNVWDYERGAVTQYAREGECSGCGMCCQRRITFSVVAPVDAARPGMGGRATTGKNVWKETAGKQKRVFFRLIDQEVTGQSCRFLSAENACTIYQDRPTICRDWPLSPEDIRNFPDCTYSFRRIREVAVAQTRERVITAKALESAGDPVGSFE